MADAEHGDGEQPGDAGGYDEDVAALDAMGAASDAWDEQQIDPEKLPQPVWPEDCVGEDLALCRQFWCQSIQDLSHDPQYAEDSRRFFDDLQHLIDDMNGAQAMMSPYRLWMQALTEMVELPEDFRNDNLELKVWLLDFHDRFVGEEQDREPGVPPEWVAMMFCRYYDKPGELRNLLMVEYPTGPGGERQSKLDHVFLQNRERKMLAAQLGTSKDADELVPAPTSSQLSSSEMPPQGEKRGEGSSSRQGDSDAVSEDSSGDEDGGPLRSQWMAENARIAHAVQQVHGRQSIRRSVQELGISPGFRVYFAGWLVAGLIFTVAMGWHAGFILLSRIFVPTTDGEIQTAGLVSCFFLFIVAIGSYLTTAQRILEQWVCMDDTLLFADTDYQLQLPSEGSARDPDAQHIPPNKFAKAFEFASTRLRLPPNIRRTFLMLPTRKIRREWYLGFMVLFTTVLPGIFSIAYVSGQSSDPHEMIGVFVIWNLTVVMCMMALYWLYMWYFGMRKKYGAWKRYSRATRKLAKSGGDDEMASREFSIMLHEFGLDDRTISRNIRMVGICWIPLALTFLVVSSSDLELKLVWVVACLLTLVILFGLREAMRSESWSNRVPGIVLLLILVLVIIAVVGTAQISGGAAGIALTLAGMSQMLLVRHRRDLATVDPDQAIQDMFHAVQTFEQRLKFMDRHEREKCQRLSPGYRGDDQPPRSTLSTGSQPAPVSEMRKMMRNVSRRMSGTFESRAKLARKEDQNKEGSIIPCFSCIRMFTTAFRCRWWCREKRGMRLARLQSRVNQSYQWKAPERYIGDEPFDPEEKLIQSVSPRAVLWFFLSFFIVVICCFEVRQELMTSTSPVPGVAPARENSFYPVCRLRWPRAANLGIVDFALLADLVYGAEPFHSEFTRLFNSTDLRLVVPEGQNARADLPTRNGPDAHWAHFYSTGSQHHIIVIQNTLEGAHLVGRDIDLWGDSMLVQVLSAGIPLLRWFSDSVMRGFVRGLAFLKEAIDGTNDDRMQPLIDYVKGLRNPTGLSAPGTEPANVTWGHVTIVGHGTNGGLAKIVAARMNVDSVAFNPPGTGWLQDKLNFDRRPAKEVSVVPTNDIVTKIDTQTGGVQYVDCPSKKSMTECHHMRYTLCTLLRGCTDRLGRTVSCPA